jgi:hypothetical protein
MSVPESVWTVLCGLDVLWSLQNRWGGVWWCGEASSKRKEGNKLE